MSNSATTADLTSDTNFAAKSGAGMVLIDEGTATEELAYSTGKTGSTLAIPLANRGLEGGSAQSHSANATIKGIFSSGMWNNLIDAVSLLINATTGAIKAGISFPTPTLVTPIVKTAYAIGAAGTTETVNWANGDLQTMTLDENVTITFSGAVAGQRLTLFMLQDGTGTNTITWADTIVWQDAITWGDTYYSKTADKMNVVVIYYSGSAYFGMVSKFA